MNTQEQNEQNANETFSDASEGFNDDYTGPSLMDFAGNDEGTDFFAGAVNEAEADLDESSLPPFDFMAAPTVKLKDGTEFHFAIPDLGSERRADHLRKTLIITSPAKVNGFNPTQETTDYATADVRYFLDNLKQFKGFSLNPGDNPEDFVDAARVVSKQRKDDRLVDITAGMMIPIKHARAAAGRIFGGKIEVDKPESDEGRVIVLNEARYICVKQQMGVEQNDDGSFTRPISIVRFYFREPGTKDMAFWQTKCFLGSKIPIKGGGSREERYFNTEKTTELFDRLIDRIEGGSIGGESLNVKNIDHLAKIPVGVKRTAVTLCMGEVSGDVGNS